MTERKARLCPKCGCIFRDGRSECHDCGRFTRPATEEELLRFEKESRRRSARSAAAANGTRPKPFQWIAAGILTAYGAVTALLLGGVFLRLLVFDLVVSAALLIPSPDWGEILLVLAKRGKPRISVCYHYRALLVLTIFAAVMNIGIGLTARG
ncbi:MAG: hypothetical protein NC084_07235 [Bacteroides sp.]|nr:hypothetical protein [Eubacterium sp.]MCM1418391.1 hypothetical protein [Roseburia sp.]MCM1462492.1 hypothetical protein [Bacteroides sp.]